MITEIPTAADFQEAGLNQIYLAWQIAMRTINDHAEIVRYSYDLTEQEQATAAAEYLVRSQPVLANAFGLVQQSMEMALKGRIAAISPYLLMSRDPKDWPSGVDRRPIPFSEFRTLDAADLIKVHNTFAVTPLDESFRVFWDGARRDRNKLMHSVSAIRFDPGLLIRTILTAVNTLFADISWPKRLLSMAAEEKYTAYVDSEWDYNIVMGQIGTAISYLTPAENIRFFGFDIKKRAYFCPWCCSMANRDGQDDWSALAQLASKRRGDTSLSCILCGETTIVERRLCINIACKCDVIYDGQCLCCHINQESVEGLFSSVEQNGLSVSQEYLFDFRAGLRSQIVGCRFADNDSAIEHARIAMAASYSREWLSVVISQALRSPRQALGTWTRESTELVWRRATGELVKW